ncbi:hypothetical protein HZC30_08110 [Candidatus Woesearchaeota archaeon]|nr:hypothetical protein [Candidatus Woesearchaeota archaeon]
MKTILDVNILLSALIRDSTTRKIILERLLDLYFPELSLHKIRKYQDYIIEKSGLTKLEFFILLRSLLGCIKIIPTEIVHANWSEAKSIMEHIDPEDVTFISAALGLGEDTIIWSDDAHFDKQTVIPVLKTKEIVELWYGNK